MAEHGYRSISLEEVATFAGVATTSVSRCWPSRADLVVDALVDAMGSLEIPTSDDPVRDLRAACLVFIEALSNDCPHFPCLVLELDRYGDDELSARFRALVLEPIRRSITDALRRAQSAGLVRYPGHPGTLAEIMMGRAVFRLTILDQPPTEEDLDETLRELIVGYTA